MSYTTDAEQWTHIPFMSSDPYQGFYDGQNMIAVTQYPTQFHISNDNGLNWRINKNVELDLKVALYMSFITVNKMLGRDLYNESNKVYYSTDGGESFDFESIEFPIRQLYNYKNELFFAYGANGVIYKSTNGGGTLG